MNNSSTNCEQGIDKVIHYLTSYGNVAFPFL